MSQHSVPVIQINNMEKHPNADNLSIIKIGGYEVIVQTKEWSIGDVACYVEPDMVVPNNEMFSFLKGHTHIKVRKFRGRYSQGLLIPLPSEFDWIPPHPRLQVGDNAMEALGITRYIPPEPITLHDENVSAPPGVFLKYDVENGYKYQNVFQEGEPVVVTEKLHGSSAKYVFNDGVMYCGSRTQWKKESETNLWWKGLRQNEWIEKWCKDHNRLCLYGEVFGQVQNLKYGANTNQIFFRAFDIWHIKEARWIDFVDVFTKYCLLISSNKWVPIIHHGKFDVEHIKGLAERDSVIPGANHCCEGVVVRPIQERHDPKLGRVQLKFVSNRYLSKGK